MRNDRTSFCLTPVNVPETSEPSVKPVHLIFRDSNTAGRSLESRES